MCLSVHQKLISLCPGPSSVAPSTQMHSISLGRSESGLMKTEFTAVSFSNIDKSTACWAAFLGNTPAPLTIPAQTSAVVLVAVKL